MQKYLIVYNLTYKKQVNAHSFVWSNKIKNSFYFSDDMPSYSGIMDKLMKETGALCEHIALVNIIPIKPEPNDIETKEVIKL